MRRRQQELGSMAVREAEQIVAVFLVPVGGLVGLFRQERRELDFLESGGVHLFADDAFDVAEHFPAEGEPAESPGRSAADVARTYQKAMAGNLCVRRIVTQCSQEEIGHPKHVTKLPAGC